MTNCGGLASHQPGLSPPASDTPSSLHLVTPPRNRARPWLPPPRLICAYTSSRGAGGHWCHWCGDNSTPGDLVMVTVMMSLGGPRPVPSLVRCQHYHGLYTRPRPRPRPASALSPPVAVILSGEVAAARHWYSGPAPPPLISDYLILLSLTHIHANSGPVATLLSAARTGHINIHIVIFYTILCITHNHNIS